MDNPEYTFQILEVFSKIKSREIPRELEEYISYVARTGDPVFQWSLMKVLIKEKLLAVLDEFMETTSTAEIPPCPNVDAFSYENMKTNLLARLDSFILPPFTIQRLCELLSAPRREYNRIDKYMRAVEKNVLVVSASDLGLKRGLEADSSDAVINGILYDKVNDSLNNVSNHVFPDEQDSDMNVSSKLSETDAVQQIIDESWNEENNDEFKLNGSGNSSLGVSFENELQFVTEKSEEKDISCESKEADSFENSSMLIEPSIQNIIAESTSISFENVSKSEDSFEAKNDTYEFKDDSQSEGASSSLLSEKDIFETSNEASDVDSVNITAENNTSESNVEENKPKYDYSEFVDTKTDHPVKYDDDRDGDFDYLPESTEHRETHEEPTTSTEFVSTTTKDEETGKTEETVPESNDVEMLLETKSTDEEKAFSSGDVEEPKSVEETETADSTEEVQPDQPSEEPSPDKSN